MLLGIAGRWRQVEPLENHTAAQGMPYRLRWPAQTAEQWASDLSPSAGLQPTAKLGHIGPLTDWPQ